MVTVCLKLIINIWILKTSEYYKTSTSTLNKLCTYSLYEVMIRANLAYN